MAWKWNVSENDDEQLVKAILRETIYGLVERFNFPFKGFD